MPKTTHAFECNANELADRLDASEADCLGNGGSTKGLVLWGNGTLTQELKATEYGVYVKYTITPLGAARFSVVKVVITPDYESPQEDFESELDGCPACSPGHPCSFHELGTES